MCIRDSAQNVAFKQGMTVAMFSLEMSKEQFVNRLFSLESKVDSQHLRTGNPVSYTHLRRDSLTRSRR